MQNCKVSLLKIVKCTESVTVINLIVAVLIFHIPPVSNKSMMYLTLLFLKQRGKI